MAGNDAIDYATLDGAVGQNWYDLDPDLRSRVRADCPPEDRRVGRSHAPRFGALVGGRIARNADVDRRLAARARALGPVGQRGRHEVVHHPAALDSKAALWESGLRLGLRRRRARRGPVDPCGGARRRELPAGPSRHRHGLQPRA